MMPRWKFYSKYFHRSGKCSLFDSAAAASARFLRICEITRGNERNVLIIIRECFNNLAFVQRHLAEAVSIEIRQRKAFSKRKVRPAAGIPNFPSNCLSKNCSHLFTNQLNESPSSNDVCSQKAKNFTLKWRLECFSIYFCLRYTWNWISCNGLPNFERKAKQRSGWQFTETDENGIFWERGETAANSSVLLNTFM